MSRDRIVATVPEKRRRTGLSAAIGNLVHGGLPLDNPFRPRRGQSNAAEGTDLARGNSGVDRRLGVLPVHRADEPSMRAGDMA